MPIPETHIPREATLVVAASDSLSPSADYVCDGTDDQVEIQAAIDALTSAAAGTEYSGGEILLLEGKYNLSAPISITTWGVHLRGSGYKSTLLYLVNDSDCNVIEIGVTGSPILNTISDLNIYGNRDNNAGTVHGIYLHNAGNPRLTRLWLDHCDRAIGTSGLDNMNVWDMSILACTIEFGGVGIYLDSFDNAHGIGGTYISHNFIVDNTQGCVFESYYTRATEFIGNDIHGCTDEAIYIDGAYDLTIVGNRIETANTTTKACIEIVGTTSAVEFLKILVNYISNGQYGVHLTATWNFSELSDNVFKGAGTSSISINANSNQRGYIRNNIDHAGILAFTNHWKYSGVAVAVGLSDAYGADQNLYSHSHTIQTAHVKITIAGVAGGETVTCKVEVLRKDGTTANVTWTPGVGANGSYWLDEDDWFALWTTNVSIYRFNISAKTDQAGTVATVSIDTYGTG